MRQIHGDFIVAMKVFWRIEGHREASRSRNASTTGRAGWLTRITLTLAAELRQTSTRPTISGTSQKTREALRRRGGIRSGRAGDAISTGSSASVGNALGVTGHRCGLVAG